MPTFVVRAWLPDRPGALGAVASRIGSVRGDVVGIDILERGGGRAIDELVVELPDESLVPLLAREVGQVDGVDVEDVRPRLDPLIDPRLDALETAAALVERPDIPSLLRTLAERSLHDLGGEWAAVVDLDAPSAPVGVGPVPAGAWLAAFIAGSRSAAVACGSAGPDDVAWADMVSAGLALVLGRRGRAFRARERRQLAAVCRIADRRWGDLVSATGVRPERRARPKALLDL